MQQTSEADLRLAICEGMRKLEALRLNRGTAGNMSTRSACGFLITPSGVKPELLRSDSIVAMSVDGTVLEADARPSSEWRFHKDIYANRADIHAVVHVHSTSATALACLGEDLPPFHYMIAVAGGATIRCAPYATFGSQALSDAALAALTDRRACLLANHGMIALGSTLATAIDLAQEVEELIHQYLVARSVGKPQLLSMSEMATVIEKFKTYGNRHGEG